VSFKAVKIHTYTPFFSYIRYLRDNCFYTNFLWLGKVASQGFLIFTAILMAYLFMKHYPKTPTFLIRSLEQITAALTVSFVAISLGAAFGIMSGRGALSGILSAGVIALVASSLGGTKVQSSGPTAPMTAVTIVLLASISDGLLDSHPEVNPTKFVNGVFLITGIILIAAATLRLGKFIRLVPSVVVSGFMNGIAILIWLNEFKSLLGIGGKAAYEGGWYINGSIALATFAIASLPFLAKLLRFRINMFLPASLVAIILITAVSVILDLNVERVILGDSLKSIPELQNIFTSNLPTEWSIPLLLIALPFAFQFALLAYLDSLLTSLVIDKKIKEVHGVAHKTKVNKELTAQGIANASISFFGGIPGAQATIRSVLIINEGGTTRIAGIMVGIFVLVEMVVFQDLVSYIPLAVFSGVLAKVGCDVFDWLPIKNFYQTLRKYFLHKQQIGTSSAGIIFITGTTLVTVFVNLSVAVIVFTILFYIGWKWFHIRV